jgi:uncharacterized protein YciI
MNYDPVVEEIHETRRKLWAECDGTMEGYSRHCEEVAREFRARVAAEMDREQAEEKAHVATLRDGGAEGELAGCGAMAVCEGEAPCYQTVERSNGQTVERSNGGTDLARKGAEGDAR